MQTIEIPNIGDVEFPDEMSMEAIANAIQTHIVPAYKAHVEKTGPISAISGAFKKSMASANEGIAQPLEEFGFPEAAAGRRKAAEEYKNEAAQTYEGVSDEEVATARQQGVIPGALKWGEKEIVEPIAGIIGRYGPQTAASLATGALAPEAALGVGAARALGFIGTDIAPEMGENIEAAREAGTGEPSLIANVSGGLVEAAIGHYGLPLTGKLAGTLFKRAEELAPRILSGELTREAAVKELGGFGINIAKEVGVNAASNAAAMTGIEATRRGVTGQELLSPEALDKYLEGAKTAAILSPVFGGAHGVMNVRGARGALPEGRAEEVPVEPTAQTQPAMDENSGTININGQKTTYTKTGERDDGEPLYTVDVPMPDSTVLKQDNLTMADIAEMSKAEPQAQAEGQPTGRPAFASDPAEHDDVTDSEVAQYITSVQEGSFDPVNDPTDAYMHEVMKMQKPEVIEYANSTVSPEPTRRRPVSDEDFDALRDEEAPEESYGASHIPYESSETPGQIGASTLVNYAGRMITVRDVNGTKVPFYLSSGLAGKKNVASGKWYPFFGVGKDGWINKTSEADMNLYYGSPALKAAAEHLDNTIGDIRNDANVPKVGAEGRHMDFINEGLTPTEFKSPDTVGRVKQNIDKIISSINTVKEPSETVEPKPSVATSDVNTGHTAESLQPHFTPEMKRLVESGKLTLHDTRDTLPGEDHPENVQGLTTPQGEVHLVASKLTPETLPRVAMHEMGVHVGMRGMVGDKVWGDLTSQALTTKGEAFDRARKSVPENTPEHLKGEETLAYLVENAPKLPIVKRAVSAIKNWARTTFGARLSITESDIHHLAAKALRKESQTSERSVRLDISTNKKGDVNGQFYTGTSQGEFPGSRNLRGSARVLAESSGQANGYEGRDSDGSLTGLPRNIKGFTPSHFKPAEQITAAYMKAAGLPYNPPAKYVKVDIKRAKRIADAYDAMPHDPQNPKVKAAYAQMIKETVAQYKAMLSSGITVEFAPRGVDPYHSSPREMTEDVRNNNHMWVFGTRDGFGSDVTFDPIENPMLTETDIEISGQKALANDLFRAVHDYFGHVKEGVGFRADGEENAWQAHMSMFSPLAGRALSTETRGQNSWLNYGPHGDLNRLAKTEDTLFADQKVGLLPEWVSAEGREFSKKSNYMYSVVPNSRIGMPHEQILKRVPELTESAKKMMDMLYDNGMLVRGTKGNLAKGVSNKDVEKFALSNPEFRKLAEAHDALVEKYKPVEPYQSLPTPATEAEMRGALKDKQVVNINRPIPDGYKVKFRLDIPSYKNKGVWVATVHEGNTQKNSIFGVKEATPIGYYGHAVGNNPKFSIEETGALMIADKTRDKYPLATVDAEYVNMSAQEAKRLADKAMTDPDWVQVGMDPERHSRFYDRKTMQPIKSGSKVIQIGSILMVKDPVYGKKSDFLYSTHKDPLINDVFKESNRTTKVDSDPTLHESIAKAVKRYTPTRISWIDPTDKIGYLLRSLDTFDLLSKKLRLDRLIQQTKQLGQVIRAVEELGVPVLKGDGTVGVKTDMRLALSEIHNRAVEFGKKHKLDGPQLIDEVARTMLGKETRAEDAKLRAYGQHLKSLADTHKQTAKHMAAQGNYSVSEINKEIRTADQLNKKAKEYLAIDREKVVTPAHIARIEAVMKKYPETKVILDDIRDLLRSHVELAHATGLIDAHTARKWNSKKDYIPMYKPEDLESFENEGSSWGIGMGSKTIKNAADYRREGHLHKINVWDNLQKHTALMVASSAQNEMRRTAVSQLSRFGEVVKAKDQGRTSVDGNLALYENGVKTWYIVKDPDALVAFQNFNYGAKPLMQMAGKMLRVGALYNPIYWYRQLVRDPLAANLVANVGGIVTPFHTVAQLAHILSGRSTNFKTLREHGVVGPVDLTHNYNSMQDQIGKAMSYDKNIWSTIKNQLIRVHEASDSATRVALYNNALKDAKKLGLSGQDAENYATHRARDSINFAVHGTSEALHTIRVSTPFFSSTLNGLDTVYRAAKQHNLSPRESKELRNRFYSRALMMSTMTAMYTILLQDDEAYKDMPASEKDGNWLIPVGKDKNGKTIFFKIPAPFEVGFLFKTLPELMVNRLNGDATNKEIFKSVRDGLIANALPPIPLTPQLLKPLVETVTNYDLHNMRPIESANELNKMVESRGEGENAFYDWLSKDLKLKDINLSPKKVQHLWQGYFAQLGAVTASLADSLITSAKGEGKTPVNPESGLLKGILTDPTKSKYKTEFYDMANDAAKIVNSLNSYDSTGQGEKVKEMVAKPETKRALQVHNMSSKAELDIADIREAINTLKHRPDSPENREEIRNLKLTENKIAKSVVKASEKIK
jgi:hypothetical protein